MKQLLKQIIKKTPLYAIWHDWKSKKMQEQEIINWEEKGRPVPPPHIVKQRTLQSYAEKFKLRILVETGTYYGDMLEALKDNFDCLYSIELSAELWQKARARFEEVRHIKLIQGNSGVELRNVISEINQPTLFWLDGHYSGGVTAKGDKETPIYEELSHIFNAPDIGHVIIIDDARLFSKSSAYPSIEELTDFIRSKRLNCDIVVKNDSIRITPKRKLTKPL
jgi:hypothetical protein